MARRFQQAEGDGETKVDISPLIDCVFILLIFFIVTTTFVDEKGVQVATPDAAPQTPPTDEEPTTIVFVLTESGDVLYEQQSIGLSGVQPVVKNSRLGSESPVIVQASGNAQAGMLMRIVDEARLAGAESVSVAHRPAGG